MSQKVSKSFLDNVLGGLSRNLPTASVLDPLIGVFPSLLLTPGVCDQNIGVSAYLDTKLLLFYDF